MKRLNKWALVGWIILSVIYVKESLAAESKPAMSGRPNIIFILADDLGYSDLGCYGGEIETPQLDALARDGLRFTQFYNTARCWPSRAALLTGYYAQLIRRDKLPGLGGGIPERRPQWARLLPDYLKPAGYRCYHSGKWHVDGKVLDGGFDRSLNISNPGNMFTRKGTQRDDQPVHWPEDETEYYVTTGTADHAIECLREHAASYVGRPFFQYLAFHAPHFPLHAMPEDIAKYRERYLDGWDVMRQRRYARQVELGIVTTPLSAVEYDVGPPYRDEKAYERLGAGELEFPRPWDAITEEQRRFQATKMAIHAAMVDRLDREIGRVVDQLKAMNAFENTLILFASDNGASAEIWVRNGGHDPQAPPGSEKSHLCLGPGFSTACNTPFRRHKVWVHEGGISTPLIVHWPTGIAARGELRHTPAHLIDFVPTVLDLLRLDRPKELHGQPVPDASGKSLVPAFAENATIDREFLWWLHEGNRALRVGDWKLVSAGTGDWELYDLRSDRGEQHNLAAKMPDKVAEMSARWQRQLDDLSSSVRRSIAPENK